MVASEGFIVRVIPGQTNRRKRVAVNSPHWACPKCKFSSLRDTQADELRGRVNLAVYGQYKPLVREVEHLPAIKAHLSSRETKPLRFRFSEIDLLKAEHVESRRARRRGEKQFTLAEHSPLDAHQPLDFSKVGVPAKYKWPTLEDRKNKRKISRTEALRQLAQTNQLSAKAQRELDRAAHRVKLGQPDKTKLGKIEKRSR